MVEEKEKIVLVVVVDQVILVVCLMLKLLPVMQLCQTLMVVA